MGFSYIIKASGKKFRVDMKLTNHKTDVSFRDPNDSKTIYGRTSIVPEYLSYISLLRHDNMARRQCVIEVLFRCMDIGNILYLPEILRSYVAS